jgi:hypothetical protein
VTTTVVVGSSTLPDAREAAAEAARGALSRAGVPALALVLATDQYDPQALAAGVTQALGAAPWAGCCAPGVFCGPRLLRQGVVVGAVVSPGARVGMGVAGPLREGGRRAGAAATATALDGFPPTAAPGWSRALLVFADASDGNAADVVRGALEIAGTGVLWAGTGVADRGLQAGSSQFALGRVHTDSVVVVALDAPARLAAGIGHGFLPYGPPTLVTRAQGAVAAELEYQPAFEIYRRAASARGDQVTAAGFPDFATTHPLGIPRADGEHVIRDPLHLDAAGGLVCSAEVPDGSLVRVMEGDRARMLDAAREAAARARDAVAGPLAGAVVFDCISRSLMLGDSFDDELRTFTAQLDEAVPLVGCLSFGEIGALGRGGPQFHNKTAVVLALGR